MLLCAEYLVFEVLESGPKGIEEHHVIRALQHLQCLLLPLECDLRNVFAPVPFRLLGFRDSTLRVCVEPDEPDRADHEGPRPVVFDCAAALAGMVAA